MLQFVSFAVLASLASAVPAPEADPQIFLGHPLTYSVPHVTYHVPVCTTELEEIKGKACHTKPVTECTDIELPSHKIVVENVCQNVTTAGCNGHGVHGIFKREADPQFFGHGVGVVPYHTCINTVVEHCYPVQSVEETTITEQSCLLRAEVECEEVVVTTIPRVTCTHEEAPAAAEAVDAVDE